MQKNESSIENVVIIGGGPAGLAASIYLARANLKPILLAGSPPGGQLTLTTEVENYPGFESILGPELIEKFRSHSKKFGVRIIDENVTKIDFSKRPFKVTTLGKTHVSKAVLIATGAKALWLGLPSETKLRGRGVSACATCDGFFFKNKVVYVVGGGDTAMEEALTLTNFAKHVIIIHRRGEFRASKIMQDRVLNHPKIHIVYNAQILEVVGDQKVEKIRVKISPSDRSLLKKTKEEIEKITPSLLQMKVTEVTDDGVLGEMPLDGLFVAIGHKPDTGLFKDQINLDSKGYITTFARISEDYMRGMMDLSGEKIKSLRQGGPHYDSCTSILGVFAAGDCVDYQYRQAATAVGMGVAAALDIERFLSL